MYECRSRICGVVFYTHYSLNFAQPLGTKALIHRHLAAVADTNIDKLMSYAEIRSFFILFIIIFYFIKVNYFW